MYRKIILAALCLFVFGFLLYGVRSSKVSKVSEVPEAPPDQLEQEKSNIISLINSGHYVDAQAQMQELTADFSGNPVLPEALVEIAERFRWSGSSDRDKDKYERARNVYRQIIKDYPESAFADKAKLGLSKTNVLSLIVAQEFDAAEQAFDEMVAEFANHPDLADELYWIGRGFGYWERHKKEKDAYQRVLQDYPDSQYADRARLGLAKANVQLLIMSQDYDGAEDALDKLLADFSEHPYLHEALYRIAERYAWADKYEEAKSIHHRIIRDYPDSSSVSWARLGYSKANILSLMMSGAYDEADKAFDKMFTDCSGHSELPRALLAIGEQCYKQGIPKEENDPARASKLYEKAAKVWDSLAVKMPDYALSSEACFKAAECYAKIGKHQDSIRCFQKVVDYYPDYEYAWHAQFMVGRNYENLKALGVISKSEADSKTKAAYEQLIEKYPNCKAANVASNWLNR